MMNRHYQTGPAPRLGFLIRVLIAKSVIDTLLIGTISLLFYYSAFSPSVRGSLDEAGPEWITGWALDFSKTEIPVEVQLYIDGRFQESRVANFPYPNLMTIGLRADNRHGFLFYTPPLEVGSHEARVYSVYESGRGERRTLQQLGQPLTFQVRAAPAEPYFKGWLDTADQLAIRGWVIDQASPATPVEVHLYIDNRFVEARTADYPRPDLKGSFPENDKLGFIFLAPKVLPGTHEVRVYAVRHEENNGRSSLRLIGRPLQFEQPTSDSTQQIH